MRRIAADDIQPTLIIVTAFGTVETAVEAMKLGAYDYVTKPLDFEELVLVVHRAMERQNLLEEVRNLRSVLDQRYGFEGIVGRAKSLLRVLDQASRVAQRDTTVLIQGETGTGKELMARAIHQNSPRKNAPFVTINCGSIPASWSKRSSSVIRAAPLLERRRQNRERLSSRMEARFFWMKLASFLWMLRSNCFAFCSRARSPRSGLPRFKSVDVRVVAATHRNLQAMIEDATFREDLYYRLAVVPLLLPPLRERREDIPELVKHLFNKAKERHGIVDVEFASGVVQHLTHYRWPGNVRELENVLERMLVLSSSNLISEADLPEEIRRLPPDSSLFWIELPEEGARPPGGRRGTRIDSARVASRPKAIRRRQPGISISAGGR